jgi:hypothetical protein
LAPCDIAFHAGESSVVISNGTKGGSLFFIKRPAACVCPRTCFRMKSSGLPDDRGAVLCIYAAGRRRVDVWQLGRHPTVPGMYRNTKEERFGNNPHMGTLA